MRGERDKGYLRWLGRSPPKTDSRQYIICLPLASPIPWREFTRFMNRKVIFLKLKIVPQGLPQLLQKSDKYGQVII